MKAWLFDVDGTLTNPLDKRIVDKDIFLYIIRKLEAGEPVGFNTGRSLDFINKEVLDPLEKLINDKSLLNHLFSVGEKGGVWISYSNGKRIEDFDNQLKPPAKLEGEVKTLVEEKFSKLMFFDNSKKTMISVEIKKGVNPNEYEESQTKLVNEFENLIQGYSDFKIDKSTIAVDIDHKKMGKDVGVKKFLELAKEKGFDPNEFVAFGDSPSDLAMIDEIKKHNKEVAFVFVGKSIENTEVIKTSAKYYKGTLEYLENH